MKANELRVEIEKRLSKEVGDALPGVAANRQVCPTFFGGRFAVGSISSVPDIRNTLRCFAPETGAVSSLST